MSRHRYSYIMTGIRITETGLNQFGFEDVFDERLLPLSEQHPGVKISLHWAEDYPYIFIGWVFGQGDPFEELRVGRLVFPQNKDVVQEMEKWGFPITEEDLDVWYFETNE